MLRGADGGHRPGGGSLGRGGVWVPGGPPGLQNRWTARRAVGGFDSRPPPPGPGVAVIWFLSQTLSWPRCQTEVIGRRNPHVGTDAPGAVALNRPLRSHPLRQLRKAVAARKR